MFGFRKNGKGNINGFLNELLPSIINVQASITPSSFFVKSDEETVSFFKNSIFYFDSIFKPVLKGNNVTISFRVNKAHEKDFQEIYENILPVQNMDFSALFRSLLSIYIINRLAVRERFLYFKNYTEISKSIVEKKQCIVFLKRKKFQLSCMAVFVSPISDRNVLLGIDSKTGNAHAIPFQLVENVVIQNEDNITVKNPYKILRKAFLIYLNTEKELQNKK
ncbi:MAG: hypothetical protein IJB97_08245 [Clostridia bacterium]|nr:hypothetical protein [Clostridia bacterium]